MLIPLLQFPPPNYISNPPWSGGIFRTSTKIKPEEDDLIQT